MVGGDYLPRNLDCLADDGRHVSIATQRGATAEFSILDVMRRRLTLTGSTLRPRSVEFKTMVADELARTVWPYVEGNRLKPAMDQSLPPRRGRRRPCPHGGRRPCRQIVLTMDGSAPFVGWSIRFRRLVEPRLAQPSRSAAAVLPSDTQGRGQ